MLGSVFCCSISIFKGLIMEIFENVKNLYDLFTEGSWIIFIFAATLILALFLNKNKVYFRYYFIPAILILFIVLNPFVINKIVNYFSPYRMVRVWWLLPIVAVLAYFFVTVIYLKNSKIFKYISASIIVLGIIFLGSYMFTSNNFVKAENIYKVPNEVIEICDAIEQDGNEGSLLASTEYVEYYRQYDANIVLDYGRKATSSGEYYVKMTESEYDVEWLVLNMDYYDSKYLVLCKNRIIPNDMELYGFHTMKETETHILYKYL